MEKEQIKELIQKAKAFASNEDGEQLADSFEEFIELYYQREHFCGNAEFALKLNAAHKRFWASFNQAAGQFGITQEFIREHFKNIPIVQTLQQEVIKAAIPADKKLRRNHKKVRI